jgi:hypothetical protein
VSIHPSEWVNDEMNQSGERERERERRPENTPLFQKSIGVSVFSKRVSSLKKGENLR